MIPGLLAAIAVFSYLLGGLNGAIIASKYVFHRDVRDYGSGNAGLTNFYRTFGAPGLAIVIGTDVLKTVIAVVAGGLIMGTQGAASTGQVFAGFCVMLGHIYPVFYGFRGGKGVLCAETMLLMPDLLGFFLTGEAKTEYTNATTSMLYNPTEKDWDWQTIDALGLPRRIFTKLDRAGSLRGKLRPELAEELGINQAHFAAVGTHDTASAVAAIPGTGSFAFCSSGTWSLFGVETDEPILTDAVRDANFSNEGTIQGGFRPLKNIMGLWLIQECRRDWQKAGMNYSWNDIVEEAKKAEPFRSIIDPDYGEFFAGGRMVEKIQAFCRDTNQPVPETVSQIARCIYESLALKYRWALERLEEIKGQRIDTLNIVGGGCQNKLLNQFAADSLNRPVITGPIEGAAIGNLLAQAMALGDIQTMDELRDVVRRSEAVSTYEPHHTPEWEAAYQKLLSFSK